MKRAQPYDRDRALDAALDLFWQKGYHATSLKDLEQALAMKPGSIYAAFKSKEALYLASLDRYFVDGRDALKALMDGAETVLGGLADYLRATGAAGAGTRNARACMIVKTILGTTEADGTISERARSYYDDMRTEFTRYFREAKAAGELPDDADPDRLAQRYQSDVTALRFEAQRGARPDEVARLAETMALDVEALRHR